jgi:hypothetical protein
MDESQHDDSSPAGQTVSGLPAEIFGLWLHSYEEDTKATKVYRPPNYPFPPSRGRNAVELRPNGTYIEYSSGPDDRGQAIAGRWQYLGGGRMQITTPGLGDSPSARQILSYVSGVLVIEK